MSNTDVIGQILTLFTEYITFMLPIIGVLAGVSFVFTGLVSVTMGLGKRTFRG